MTMLLARTAAQRQRHHSRQLTAPQLSIVVVNYCQWPNTVDLVRQICRSPHTRQGRVEVVVVDNHSPPSGLMRPLQRWPGVSLRRWGSNRGFARAVNEGCRLSQGGWLLLLNPDVTIADEFLDGVVRLSEELTATDARAGIVGFQLRNTDGGRQLSWGPFPSLQGTLARMLLPRWRRKYSALPIRQRCQVPWVTGCCLLIRRDCLKELAGLDDSFFLYYEDVDLCRRAAAAGWTVSFEPNLNAIHHHPLHTRKVPAILRLVTRHSLLTYAERHWPVWQMRLLAGVVRLEAGVRRWFARCRGDFEHAELMRELQRLADEVQRGDHSGAAARLARVLRSRQKSLAAYASG